MTTTQTTIIETRQAKRDDIAQRIREARRDYPGAAAAMLPLLRKTANDAPPKPTRENLLAEARRLSKFSRTPIPSHLPCGTDDYEGYKRNAARELATDLYHAARSLTNTQES